MPRKIASVVRMHRFMDYAVLQAVVDYQTEASVPKLNSAHLSDEYDPI